ncbi:hypothetical protein [Burkholderia pseudomallei]|uniref:hypothetical protein n=1 Tax=Burkholderia pseudomallei TaxID=28450 RepID=UPI003877E21D
MVRMLIEFGMTPSSRSHCKVTEPDDQSPHTRNSSNGVNRLWRGFASNSADCYRCPIC